MIMFGEAVVASLLKDLSNAEDYLNMFMCSTIHLVQVFIRSNYGDFIFVVLV